MPKHQFLRGCYLNKHTKGLYKEYIGNSSIEADDMLGLMINDKNNKIKIFKEDDILYKMNGQLSDKYGNPI